MTHQGETTFTNLAQVMAANDKSFKGLSDFVLSPIADALAKIGIAPTRPQILSILSQETPLAVIA
jgi:phage-related minor tail protein